MSCGVTSPQRIGADLIHVVSARLARADRGLDRLDLEDINDGLLTVAADSVHGEFTGMGRSGASLNGGVDIFEGLLERLAVQIVRSAVDLASQVLG